MSVYDLTTTDALLSTTRSVRKRLDLERAVPREIILRCIELSQQAPTGSNSQRWQWLVVTDAEKRKALADIYREGASAYLAERNRSAFAAGNAQNARVFDSARYLLDHLQDVPVHVLPCIDVAHIAPDAPRATWAAVMGSISPAVWSFQLALRARGLGSVLTTLHLSLEAKAGALLGIPSHMMQVALVPVAYTVGTDFKPARRPPVETIVHWEQWPE